VADTPGLREVGLWGIDPDDLDLCFPEFHRHLDHCRFGRSCSHTHEPDCAVREAVETGEISPARYESYSAMRPGGD
jgi:ribosome biogenesis GTPase / thiamine phosphate phosphatase